MRVDDSLWTVNEKMLQMMNNFGKKFGGVSEAEGDKFVFIDRHFKSHANCEIFVDMMVYAAGIETVAVPRARRHNPDWPVTSGEFMKYHQIVGNASSLVTQMKVGLCL